MRVPNPAPYGPRATPPSGYTERRKCRRERPAPWARTSKQPPLVDTPFWTNAKTGEVSLEDPMGREKAVEEMSFDERRAHDAKQAFMQQNKGNRKQNKGTGGGRGGRRRR